MEKFTVDLDKVLDEFEFNEEQAIRHALQHFKREDLPATKYQKPHFKPINIADADFGPCLETTMSYSDFHPSLLTQGSGDSSAGLNSSISPKVSDHKHQICGQHLEYSTNCNYLESNESGKSFESVKDLNGKGLEEKLIENQEGTNGGKREEKIEEKRINDEEISIIPALAEEVAKIEHTKKQNAKDNAKGNQCEIIENNTGQMPEQKNESIKKWMPQKCEDIVKEKEMNDICSDEVSGKRGESISRIQSESKKTEQKESKIGHEDKTPSVVEGKRGECDEQEICSVEENWDVRESQIKPDLIENESADFRSNNMSVNCGKKLPDLTEVSVTNSSEREREREREREKDEDDNLGSIQSHEKTRQGVNAESAPMPAATDLSVNREPVELVKDFDPEITPIQFDSQLDITDEELQRCLEELEEEEEEEEEKRRKTEAESKPTRPDSLHLDEHKEGLGSPGLTPLVTSITKEEELSFGEKNFKEDAEEDQMNNGGLGEESEGSLSASVLSESSEFPLTVVERRLGKVSPFWMPDHLASSCMECDNKFTVIKRRHHCRACGRILCSKCCGMRASLEYLQNQEQRVCETCFRTLAKVMMYELQNESENESESSPRKRPNPNNPMEYCSTVPPPLQVSGGVPQPPPSVLVPVGVLKREGSSKVKETPKQVIFSDGIRPGGDLTELDGSGDQRNGFRKSGRAAKRAGTPPGNSAPSSSILLPPLDPESQSFILEKGLPPICISSKGETTYEENWPLTKIMDRLRDASSPPLQFAINRNLTASVKIVKLECCMKETCWVICSKGMGCVGQDEIIVLLTLKGEEDDQIPKDIFLQFHYIYKEAARGNTVNELGYWCVKESPFLDSKQHGGFLFVRSTFQCLNRIEVPPPPFLFGILIHRSEIPWARVFPFRLMLRLGAEFRYYPCPLVSVRFREPVYYEVGHTIINLLADFRNLSYTLPSVRGLRIHMEANQTSILIPRNRYDQVIRALNNSNDPVLALAGNFSPEADAHLVCMQSKGDEITYSTHAININDKPRQVTGASFVVLNGALKTTSGMAAKSSIVEDGLMVQVPSDTMTVLRTKLRNMEDWSVRCGPREGRNAEEVVRIIWCEDDKNFNVGVKSVIDNMPLDGVPSIRVHSSKDYMGCAKFIRWTQVFIIKCEDGATSAKIGDPLEVNKLSESIAKATCLALTKLLELLSASGLTVLAVRTTIDQDNVGYEAGSNGEKLAPIYMNSLDNELIPVLHKAASSNDSITVLELMFHIMDQ